MTDSSISFARGDGIFADDHSVGDLCNCLSRHANAARVFSERLRIRGLIDADSSDAAVLMLGYVRTNPAHAVWHLFVADAGGDFGGGFELGCIGPGGWASDDVGVQCVHGFNLELALHAPCGSAMKLFHSGARKSFPRAYHLHTISTRGSEPTHTWF
jgi:hypothetical protein